MCDTGDTRIEGCGASEAKMYVAMEDYDAQSCTRDREDSRPCGRAMKHPAPPRVVGGLDNGGIRDSFRGEGSRQKLWVDLLAV